MDDRFTPLGRLLEAARTEVLRISGREAARRAGITEARWRQVVTGVQTRAGGVRVPVNPRAVTVVAMALAVQVQPTDALKAAEIDAGADSVAALIEEAKQSIAARVRVPQKGDELADEIERIRDLPISAKARRRLIDTVLGLYEEAAKEEQQEGRPRSA